MWELLAENKKQSLFTRLSQSISLLFPLLHLIQNYVDADIISIKELLCLWHETKYVRFSYFSSPPIAAFLLDCFYCQYSYQNTLGEPRYLWYVTLPNGHWGRIVCESCSPTVEKVMNKYHMLFETKYHSLRPLARKQKRRMQYTKKYNKYQNLLSQAQKN